MDGLGIGHHHDHLGRALGESAFHRSRHMDFLAPLFRAYEIAVQGIHHGIPSGRVEAVTGWQNDQYVAVFCIAFQIAFQRRAVNLDALDGDGPCARDGVGQMGLNLGLRRDDADRQEGECQKAPVHHANRAPRHRYHWVYEPSGRVLSGMPAR